MTQQQNEDPGALAGATEVDLESLWNVVEVNAKRAAKARGVVDALLRVDPQDRPLVLDALRHQFRAGAPQAYVIDLMMEAAHWVEISTQKERRAYFFSIWAEMTQAERASFRQWAQGEAAA